MIRFIENLVKNTQEELIMTPGYSYFTMPEIDFGLSDMKDTKLDDFVTDELKIDVATGFETDLFGEDLQNPEVLQKIKLKIDENGAEGAAATMSAIST